MKNQLPIPGLPFDLLHQSALPEAEIPAAIDTEAAVLGLMMLENNAATEMAMLKLTPDSFLDPRHRTIFEAIVFVNTVGGKVDLYTLAKRLKDDRSLAEVGGVAYLTELTQKVASGSHAEDHVMHLLQCQVGRNLAASAWRALRSALDGSDINDTLETLQAALENTLTIGLANSHAQHIDVVATQAAKDLQHRAEKARLGQTTGITTGFADLDRLTGGWQGSQLIVLAARPAMGKTAIMLHFALSAAKSGVPVRIYSLEMSSPRLFDRLIPAVCEVSAENYRSGKLSTSEWAETKIGEDKLKGLPIYFDDKGGVSMRHIATHAKIAHRRGECELILIDYLQLMDVRTAERGRNREQEVAQCSKAAKELAKELGIPVVILAQLSRAVEGRGGSKEPMLSDLRESGAIEQDADIVLFPHRPEYYLRDGENPMAVVPLSNGRTAEIDCRGLGKIIVAKQRDGATGNVRFHYNGSMSRFWDFDERPYTTPSYAATTVRARDNVSSGSINYCPNEADDLPF